MNVDTLVEKQNALETIRSKGNNRIHLNLNPAELVEFAILRKEGRLSDTGALAADTGKFTGRSPKDKFTVVDDVTEDSVWWGDINLKFNSERFDKLYNKVIDYLSSKELFVKDAYACALPE